jgi:hypothetical protein
MTRVEEPRLELERLSVAAWRANTYHQHAHLFVSGKSLVATIASGHFVEPWSQAYISAVKL